ncbi:MAG: polyhydroxyalkanoate synthesis repressor PhaR [Rhodobacteraceae bacterium]|nr:polyhydroxyalkanoate synthesis repressor PhaR [Paracoccaceae bacterium]
MTSENSTDPVVIKKYANRRLYNTQKSSYVTLDDLAQMVRDGQDFVVKDAKSGDDITRTVLTQIIFEEESKGQNLLPIKFLRQLIGFYGDSLEGFVPGYLEESMENFTRNQDKLREQVGAAIGTNPLMTNFESMTRGNVEWMENAVKMFSPFANNQPETTSKSDSETETSQKNPELDALKIQLSEMQAQLAKLVGGS